MKRLSLMISMMILLTLGLSACVGSANASNNTVTLHAKMTEFAFTPSTWTVPAGKEVSIVLQNSGTTPHTWTVMSKPVSGSYTAADKANILFDSGPVTPGSSKTVSFTAPSTPGTYQVICTQPGHFEAGMVGQLTVQ